SGERREIMYTPEVTMVAAWISADTGVGPAIASGSQMYSGICADLPVAPTNSNRQIAVTTVGDHSAICVAMLLMSGKLNDGVPRRCRLQKIRNMPTRNAASPTRLAMKALRPATALAMSVYQKPTNR